MRQLIVIGGRGSGKKTVITTIKNFYQQTTEPIRFRTTKPQPVQVSAAKITLIYVSPEIGKRRIQSLAEQNQGVVLVLNNSQTLNSQIQNLPDLRDLAQNLIILINRRSDKEERISRSDIENFRSRFYVLQSDWRSNDRVKDLILKINSEQRNCQFCQLC